MPDTVGLWSKWNKEANKRHKDRMPGSKKNPIKANPIKVRWDFGGNPSDQSWNPTREEVKEWNKESNKWNQAKKNTKWLNATRVKQVLPTVGRAIGIGTGWGALITGVSLLAQTKKAKQFRQDPIYRKETIKKLLRTNPSISFRKVKN